MNLKFNFLDTSFKVENFSFNTLVIENKSILRKLKYYLSNEFESKDPPFIVYKGIDLKKADSCCFYISNLFDLDLNTKKNTNSLYKILKSLYIKNYNDDIEKVRENFSKIVRSISMDFEIELSIKDKVEIDDLFKIVDLKINDDIDDLVIRLEKFIKIMYELHGIRYFFIEDIHKYLDENEINSIIDELKYIDICVLNVEKSRFLEKIEKENRYFIDEIFCTLE